MQNPTDSPQQQQTTRVRGREESVQGDARYQTFHPLSQTIIAYSAESKPTGSCSAMGRRMHPLYVQKRALNAERQEWDKKNRRESIERPYPICPAHSPASHCPPHITYTPFPLLSLYIIPASRASHKAKRKLYKELTGEKREAERMKKSMSRARGAGGMGQKFRDMNQGRSKPVSSATNRHDPSVSSEKVEFLEGCGRRRTGAATVQPLRQDVRRDADTGKPRLVEDAGMIWGGCI